MPFVRTLFRSALMLALLAAAGNLQAETVSGHVAKNGKAMDVVDTLAIWHGKDRKLEIFFLPAVLSEADKQGLLEKSMSFFVFASKESPDSGKWDWYPYASLSLMLEESRTGLDDISHAYLMAYGIERQNSTDNLNYSDLRVEEVVQAFTIEGDPASGTVTLKSAGKGNSGTSWDVTVTADIVAK